MDPAGERPRCNNAMGSQLCTLFCFFQSGRNNRPNLNFQDLAVDDQSNPSLLRIRLKYSKTDQLGRGIDIVLGRTYQDICPVAAAMAYLTVRRDGEGPLFKFADGHCLTKERFTRHIREALAALGLRSADYAGHSFRIGAATTAAQVGLEDSTIRTLGRWKSDVYLNYVRLPRDHLASISRSLISQQWQKQLVGIIVSLL